MAAYQPIPSMAVYAASKAFVLSFTEALWGEARGTGLRVMSAAPGLTRTEFFDAQGSAAYRGRYQTPEQVVENVLRAIERSDPPPSMVSGRGNSLGAALVRLLSRRRAVLVAARAGASSMPPARDKVVTDAGSTRPRNPRGQGARLRDDIVRAAGELMDEHGTDQAVTLRAVARRLGISVPSIYAHFPDVAAIFRAVVEDAFVVLEDRLGAAASGSGPDPVERLHTIGAAYLTFAFESPLRYRLLFGGLWSPPEPVGDEPARPDAPLLVGEGTFAVIRQAVADCVDAGRSGSEDMFATATACWVTLHGLAGLQPAAPRFPWPADLLGTLLDRVALID